MRLRPPSSFTLRMNSVRKFLVRTRKLARKRKAAVTVAAMGRERIFQAWDLGDDTFIFEQGVEKHLDERPSVLVVEKRALDRRSSGGFVMTLTTGNHAVAAFPLLDGRFWRLAHLSSAKRGEVLMRSVLCANVVDGTVETSQRDLTVKTLVSADEWLQNTAGFRPGDIVMGDRNEFTLDYYRRLGQEWRVKPLAWTSSGMRSALAASRKRITSKLLYYHSARGVHFLSFAEFKRFAVLAESAPDEFVKALREMVSVFEGNRYSFTRMPKYRGHHEVEFFGLRRGVAVERLVPELERLMEAVALGRTGQLGVIQKVQEIVALYESLLTRPEFADEESESFIEALYMCITGEVYAVVGEGSTPAFDDHRTALPGARFIAGRPVFDELADERTRMLLINLRRFTSKDERILYANVYELREGGATEVGRGDTREVVYRTDRSPLENSLVEKRLSSARKGYGSYMLARVGALRSLGISLSPYYRLLHRHRLGRRGDLVDHYIRFRCEGEPMDSIPASYFCNSDDASIEEPSVVKALAVLMGDAAAQNMAMKKFDAASESPLYGVGKEIYEFEFDIASQRIVPKRVATCSVRGSFGWPKLEYTEENLAAMANFYLGYYAHSLKDFQQRHHVEMAELAESFLAGFEYRTHALAWQLSVMRDQFEDFHPELPRSYGFERKWRFLMWALDRQERRITLIRKIFLNKVKVLQEV